MWSEILDLLDVHYTCISNFHLWHTRVFCKNIWERSILLHSKILWKPTEPDHQTTSIDCPSRPRPLLLGDSPVTAWPGSLRRLLSLRAASAPAAANPFPVPSLGQGAEPDTVANALLRPGCFNVWILVFVFQDFSNTYCRLVKLVQYSEQRDGSCSCWNPNGFAGHSGLDSSVRQPLPPPSGRSEIPIPPAGPLLWTTSFKRTASIYKARSTVWLWNGLEMSLQFLLLSSLEDRIMTNALKKSLCCYSTEIKS